MPQREKKVLEGLRQPLAIYQFLDKRVVAIALSDGFCKLFGYEDRALAYYDMNHDMYKDTHPDDVARISNAAISFATEGGKYEVVYRTKQKDSDAYTVVHAMGEHVYTDDGVRLAHVWYTDEGTYVEDSVDEKNEVVLALSNALHEQSIIKASRYDYLTGLPSMTYFFELAELGKNNILKNGSQPLLMYIDLSGMKFFNNNYGFEEGDKMLHAFARLLAHAFGNENCCRIGADHFAVISEEKGLPDILRKLFKKFGELYGGKTPPVHVGIYPYGIENIPISSACVRAKLACTTLNGVYFSAYNYYSADLRDETLLKRYIIENIDTAIKEKWIQVYLQPIIRAVNERVCDVEALARWIDPVRGVLSPASFIPALEDSGLIYKLDLYMVEQVLELIKSQMAEGFFVVPHSINLSRSDFDACDIVEEIRKRVDEAGISRDRITIEITESIIGSDFEFMKEQVERFQRLGFPVWMDDFGSGYSSLDVLQSIKFDLLKFDMGFLKRLNEGKEGKIILTELMKMATSLGLDTVCEGVETESQIRFLQDIGCSKLQGFYYSKPLPFKAIRQMQKNRSLIAHENPEESAYYESIGRVNLYDLGIMAIDEESAFQNVFATLPMAILEVKEGIARYARSNLSYQEFIMRFFNIDILNEKAEFDGSGRGYGQTFIAIVRQCCNTGSRAFFDERMPDGSVVHAFARRINKNPVTGSVAVAVAILSITEPDDSTTYAEIARALAADYYNIYVIDLDTDDYIEYSSQVGGEELLAVRSGKEFFEEAKRETMTRIYEQDRASFLALFSKERVLKDLDSQGVFTTTYRLIDTGTPMYVNMKITRMHGGNRIILGISIVDAHEKQKKQYERLQKEQETLVRVMALSDGYLSIFTVDPISGSYVEYSSSAAFDSLGAAKDGDDFFGQAYIDTFTYCYPPDRKRFQEQVTKENVLRKIRQNGKFSIDYRLIIEGVPRPVTLKAALFTEGGEEKLVVGVRAWRERQEG